MFRQFSHAVRGRSAVLAALVAMVAMLSIGAAGASAASFKVENRQDEADVNPGDGECEAANGKCTLRAGFDEANALPSDDRLRVEKGIYRLEMGQLEVTTNGELSVRGDRSFGRATAIDAQGDDRVIEVLDGAQLKLFGVSVTGGETNGEGGGILTGINSRTKVIRSRVNGNRTFGSGGGIANAGRLIVKRSDIETNSADTNGGGISNGPSILQLPRGANGEPPSVSLFASRVNNNDAEFGGGGIYAGTGEIESLQSTTSGNTAGQFGGGILASPLRSNEVESRGNGPGDPLILLLTSTVSSNKAGITGLGQIGEGSGGAIMLFAGAGLISDNSTIADNTNNAGEIPTGAGLAMDGGEAEIRNTIIAENRTNGEMDNCRFEETGGVIESLGHNLENLEECAFDRNSDFQNKNPRIGRLRLNPPGPNQGQGFRGETHRIASNSPAHDGGPNNCGPTDQRGVTRPRGESCDIGSFERKKP